MNRSHMTQPKLNLTPLLLRDVEDLASLAKSHKGKHSERLFARTSVIIAVIALDHFINLYLEQISPDSEKKKRKEEIERLRRTRRIGSTVAAKWYVVSDLYTPNRFLPNVSPFSDFKKAS